MLILKATKRNGIKIFEKGNYQNEPVIFPTDTIYGIGAFFDNIDANRKIFDFKNRDKNKPFPIIISNMKQLNKLEAEISEEHLNTLKKFWPGKFTFILNSSLEFPYCTVSSKVAVRMIEKNYLHEVIEYFDTPITATSANLSDEPYLGNPKSIIKNFKNIVTYFLYSKITDSLPSTVVDLTFKKPLFLRNPLNFDENIFK